MVFYETGSTRKSKDIVYAIWRHIDLVIDFISVIKITDHELVWNNSRRIQVYVQKI